MGNRFYVYCLLRLDTGAPCYIGKGSGRRMFTHGSATKHRNPHLLATIRKYGVAEILVRGNMTETEAFETEISLISAIGRGKAGPLANLTDGGEGNSGWSPNDETRLRMSAAQIGKKLSVEHCAKMRAAQIGKKISAETIAKMILVRTGTKRSAETKAKMSAWQIGRKHSDETRAKISAAKLGEKRSEETRAKMSASLTGMKRGPRSEAHREKLRAANVGKKLSAETRSKMSAAQKLRRNAHSASNILETDHA